MQERTRHSRYAEPKPRVKLWRDAKGWSQKQLGDSVRPQRMTQSQIARIEAGQTALTIDKAKALADALEVAPVDLMPDAPLTVPVRYMISTRTARNGWKAELSPPHRRVPAPVQLAHAELCFAAEVADTSADRMFPAGTLLFVRPFGVRAVDDPADQAVTPHKGDRVLVAEYETTLADKKISRVLMGEFVPSMLGDLMVQLRSNDRAVPAAIYVREAPVAVQGFADAAAHYEPPALAYVPRPDDPAELIGVVQAVTMSLVVNRAA